MQEMSGLSKGTIIESFEQLEHGLRGWRSFLGPDEEYDVVGMFNLLMACVGNLREHALEAEIENYAEVITEAERAFLRKLCDAV